MKIKTTILTLLLVYSSILSQEVEPTHIFKRIKIDNPTTEIIQKLEKAGIDIECGAYFKNDNLILELTENEIIYLEENLIGYKTLIDDLTKFYSERAAKDMPKAITEYRAEKAKSLKLKAKGISNKSVSKIINNVGQHTGENEINWVQPVNWNLNTESPNFGGCLTHDMVLQELDDMRNLYPNLISVKTNVSPSNQKTIEGRTIYYVRISDNPDIDEDEPETLYQSLIHSREAGSLMQLLYFMWYILENYDNDPAIRSLVNNQELYFIPILNPDGFVYNEVVAPNGGGGQRKNRNTSAPGTCNTYFDGIDLNRNSAYYWGNGGSSTNSCNDTYMGAGPFSENETQILRDFFLQHNFKLALNHHSYKNAMLHAYAGVNQAYPTVNGNSTIVADMYSKYNHDMTYYNRYMYGPSTQVTSLNSGNMNDWMLGGPAGISTNGTPTGTGSGKYTLAWTPENGLYSEGNGGPGGTYQGFWPAPSNYDDIAKRAMRPNFMAAYFSGKYAKIHDMTPSNITGNGNLTFGLENLGRTDGEFTITITPISGFSNVGNSVIVSGMEVLEQRYINIPFILDTNLLPNVKIEYKVTLTNDYDIDNVLYEANFEKYFNPTILISDNPDTDDLTNWAGSGWSTTAQSYSGTKAITSGSYSGSSTKRIQLNNTYNFINGTEFLIQYFAKWDLERSFDYVQIEASTNGTTWTPLIGNYTKPGAPNANNDYSQKSTANNNFQPDFQHLYDGDTAGKWIMEEIVIDNNNNSTFYNKENVYLRFEFRSDSNNRKDSYVNADFEGFQFDDFKIIAIQEPCELVTPSNVEALSVTNNAATISWDEIPSAVYEIQYKEQSDSGWITLTSNTNAIDLTSLTPSTTYDYRVRSSCDTNYSSYTSVQQFQTLAVNYCDASSSNTNFEYISNVKIGDIENSSPNQPVSGYSDFTNFTFTLKNNTQHTLSVTKEWPEQSYNERVRVWIDYNRDGDFEDSGEEIFYSSSNTTPTVATNFTIPTTAQLGTTRMRVIMRDRNISNSCINYTYGEVEDYTVNIVDATLGIDDPVLSKFSIYPNPSTGEHIAVVVPQTIKEYTVEVYSQLGQVLYKKAIQNPANNTYVINDLQVQPGLYIIKISTPNGKASKNIIIQ